MLRIFVNLDLILIWVRSTYLALIDLSLLLVLEAKD